MPRMHNIFGGGNKTNKNGLKFERDTSLDDVLINAGYTIKDFYVYDRDNNMIGLSVPQNNLYKNFLEKENIDYKKYNSKKWKPDEAFINFKNKTVYIIEKKYQATAGSVDEKLPNCDFKKKEYEKLFTPLEFKVEFIYVLSKWFFEHETYRDTLEYIRSVGCEYFSEIIPFESLGLEKDD